MTSPQSPDGSSNGGQRPQRRALILAGIGGALAGAVAVGAIWLGTSLSFGADPDAAADADVACQILDGVPTLTLETLGLPYANRVSAASEMASVADQTRAAIQATSSADVKGANESVRAARDTCDGL